MPRWLRTGVAACADLPARVLSAGQRRRVAMARVLAMHATVWLLDEPYTNLDAAGSRIDFGVAADRTLRAGGLALVVAHHELNAGLQYQAHGAAFVTVGAWEAFWLDCAPRDASQFSAPGATIAAPGVLSHCHHAVSAGIEPAAVAAARHRAGCALGGGTAIVAAVAGLPVQKRRG